LRVNQFGIQGVDHLIGLSRTEHSWKAAQAWNQVIRKSFFATHAFIQSISHLGEEAAAWEKMARGYQTACDLYSQAAAAYEAGNETEGKRYKKEGDEAETKVWDWTKYE